MKIIGCLLILLSGYSFSIELIKPIKTRITQLNDLCKGLEIMIAELSSRPCTMEELACIVSDKCSGQTKRFFHELSSSIVHLGEKSFFDIWSECVSINFKKFSSMQLDLIRTLGNMLGVYELSEQLKAIQLCLDSMRIELNQEKDNYPTSKKLCFACPMSISAMLIVVLL